MDQHLRNFIEGMPKIELHLHIEGSLEPEMALKLAKRNGIALTKKDGAPYKDADELRAAYKFSNLQEFLDLIYQGMSVLKTEQDYYDLTMAYLQKIKSQNVIHTEIFFDPQEHTARGVAFETVITCIKRALTDAENNMGISSKLIMSFVRHRSEEEAFKCLEEARPFMSMIDGFGLDSSEKPFPPHLFERVFAEARKTGKPVLAHAGEEGPADYVWQALDKLKVSRIDHGNHSLDDPALTQRLADEKMGLTVCPLSNLKLCHTLDFATDKKLTDMKDHPLKKMLDHGLKASVNSDDPAYFGGYMNENFIAVAEALNLTRDDVIQLARNAIDTSFLSVEQKGKKSRELDNYIAKMAVVDAYANPSEGRTRSATE